MEQLIQASGVSKEIITLLIMLPVAGTMIGVFKHIIGLKSMGIFIALIITFVFYQLWLNSTSSSSNAIVDALKYGLLLLIVVTSVTTLTYGIIKSWSMHYYPKFAIILTNVTLSLFVLVLFAGSTGIAPLIILDTVSLLLVAMLGEKIMSVLARKSFNTLFWTVVESSVVSVTVFLLITFPDFQKLMFEYPWLLILLFPINYLIGTFTGLRLKEYYRFRNILDSEE